MKKLILSIAISVSLVGYVFAQGAGNNTCLDAYQSGKTKGYNALATAVDGGFSVCAYVVGQPTRKIAEKNALDNCEKARRDPAEESQGIRKVMTHCRIVEFSFIE
ncbi:hypothetical protein KKA14_19685 [bacterium]|nr:hypothetical protein [bacterium]